MEVDATDVSTMEHLEVLLPFAEALKTRAKSETTINQKRFAI
jgi:hypothetical protein